MAKTWLEYAEDERYKKLSNEEKQIFAQNYLDNVISQNPKYSSLEESERDIFFDKFNQAFQKTLTEPETQPTIKPFTPEKPVLTPEMLPREPTIPETVGMYRPEIPLTLSEKEAIEKISTLGYPVIMKPAIEPEKPISSTELAKKYGITPAEVISGTTEIFKEFAPKIREEREKGKKVGWDYTPSEAYALYIHKTFPELENSIGMNKEAMAFVSALIDKTPIGIFTGLVAPIMGAKRQGRIWEQAHSTEASVGGMVGDLITILVGYKFLKPSAMAVSKSKNIISALQRIKNATRTAQTADALVRTAQVWGLQSLARDFSDMAKGETDKSILQIIKDASISTGAGALFGGGLAYATGAASLPKIYLGRGLAGGVAGAGATALQGGKPEDIATSGFTMALFGVLTTPMATKFAKLQAIKTARNTYAKYLQKTKRQLASSLKNLPSETRTPIREQYLKSISEINKQTHINLAELENALKSGKYLPKDFNEYANNLLGKIDNTLMQQQAVIDKFVGRVTAKYGEKLPVRPKELPFPESEITSIIVEGKPEIKIGDKIQWTSGGMKQFTEPKSIRGFTGDRKFVFVEGEKTGIPTNEISIEKPTLGAELKLSPTEEATKLKGISDRLIVLNNVIKQGRVDDAREMLNNISKAKSDGYFNNLPDDKVAEIDNKVTVLEDKLAKVKPKIEPKEEEIIAPAIKGVDLDKKASGIVKLLDKGVIDEAERQISDMEELDLSKEDKKRVSEFVVRAREELGGLREKAKPKGIFPALKDIKGKTSVTFHGDKAYLPKSLITEDNTPYLSYMGTQKTNDVDFKNKFVGLNPLYGKDGKAIDQVFEEIPPHLAIMDGAKVDYDAIKEKVIEEINMLENKTTPMERLWEELDLQERKLEEEPDKIKAEDKAFEEDKGEVKDIVANRLKEGDKFEMYVAKEDKFEDVVVKKVTEKTVTIENETTHKIDELEMISFVGEIEKAKKVRKASLVELKKQEKEANKKVEDAREIWRKKKYESREWEIAGDKVSEAINKANEIRKKIYPVIIKIDGKVGNINFWEVGDGHFDETIFFDEVKGVYVANKIGGSLGIRFTDASAILGFKVTDENIKIIEAELKKNGYMVDVKTKPKVTEVETEVGRQRTFETMDRLKIPEGKIRVEDIGEEGELFKKKPAPSLQTEMKPKAEKPELKAKKPVKTALPQYDDYRDVHEAVGEGKLKIGDKVEVSAYGGITVEIVKALSGEIDALGLPIKYRIKEVKLPPPKVEKQPYEMTRGEYIKDVLDLTGRFSKQGILIEESKDIANKLKTLGYDTTLYEKTPEQRHQKLIKQALSEGKTVPDNVLEDYPELVKERIVEPGKTIKEIKEEIPKEVVPTGITLSQANTDIENYIKHKKKGTPTAFTPEILEQELIEAYRAEGITLTAPQYYAKLRKIHGRVLPINERKAKYNKAFKQPMYRVTTEQAKGLSYKTKLPKDKIFVDAVKNTPDARITKDGLVINVVRYQLQEQEGELSVRTGVFYLPASDKNVKHYKGKSGYGGAVKYEGETLIKRPIFVKGATGGKAPRVAYNQIKGKGSYEKMRSDVLGKVSTYGRKVLPESVAQILTDYNKDTNYDENYDMAYDVVRVSTKGNTLAYAIQENIVAHAVRNAGHDSVIGYSKRRDGTHFISEIFDVREISYPSNEIESDIHEKFLEETIYRQAKTEVFHNASKLDIRKLEIALRNLNEFFVGNRKVFLKPKIKGNEQAVGLVIDDLIHIKDTMNDPFKTLLHEDVHIARNLLLTPEENAGIDKALKGLNQTEEQFSEDINTYTNKYGYTIDEKGIRQTFLGRLREYVRKLIRALRRFFGRSKAVDNLENTYYKILKGKLGKREVKTELTPVMARQPLFRKIEGIKWEKRPVLSSEQIKEMNRTKQAIWATVNEKGMSKAELYRIVKNKTGFGKLTHREMTSELLSGVLRSVRATRPKRIDHKIVITPKTEKEIKKLRSSLQEAGVMDDKYWDWLLKSMNIKTATYIDKKNFITESQGKSLLRRMKIRISPDVYLMKFKEPGLLKYVTPKEYYLRVLGLEPLLKPIVDARKLAYIEGQNINRWITNITKRINKQAKTSIKENAISSLLRKPTDAIVKMRDLLDTYEVAPSFLSEEEQKLFNELRDFTKNMLDRTNKVRKALGLEEIKEVKAYITHYLDELAKQIIQKKYPFPEDVKYWLGKNLPKKIYNPRELERKVREDLDNMFSKDLGRLLRALSRYDLRDVYLSEPHAVLRAELSAIGSNLPARTRRELDDFLRFDIFQYPTELDQAMNVVLDKPTKFINMFLRPLNRVITNPIKTYSSVIRRCIIDATIWGRPKLAIRNILTQKLLTMNLYPVHLYLKAQFLPTQKEMMDKIKKGKFYQLSIKKFEDIPITLKPEAWGMFPYQKSHAGINYLSNVNVAEKVGWYYAEEMIKLSKDKNSNFYKYAEKYSKTHDVSLKQLLWNDSDKLAEAEDAGSLTQWLYFTTDMPQFFRGHTKRAMASLQSWWMNFYFKHIREAFTRTFTGRTSRGKLIKPSDRTNWLKGTIIILGLLEGVRRITGLDYGRFLFLWGPAPAYLSPPGQLLVGLYGVLTAKTEWQRNKALRQMKYSWRAFIPGSMAWRDLIGYLHKEKTLKELLFYTKRPKTTGHVPYRKMK